MKLFPLNTLFVIAAALGIGLVAASAQAASEVEVQQLDGSSRKGRLVELTSQKLTLQTDEENSAAIDLKQIISVTPAADVSASPSTTPTTARLTLADGSTLLLGGLVISSRSAELQLSDGAAISIGKSALKGARLFANADAPREAAETDPLQGKWQTILDQHTGGDAIVINREGDLTVQEVVIHAMNEEGVKIQLDDITTTVNPSKLFGLLFFQRGTRELPAPLCVVHLNDGSQLVARGLNLIDAEQVKVTTLIGTEISLPLPIIRKFDYAAGNIQFLDELSPTRVTWTPVLRSGIDLADLSLVYAPRMNTSYEGEPLQLEEKGLPEVYARGIAVHATSELLYDLPSGFRQLQLKAGVAPRSLAMCTAKLQIVGDQKVLYEQEFTGETSPEEVTLNVANVRRLKIIVDAADGEDFGDVLHLVQARLLK